MIKKIQDVTTEKQFLSKLRTFYRKLRRKGYLRNEISFLGIMETVGQATTLFWAMSGKYFNLGFNAYDWVNGNSLLESKIDVWENEFIEGK